MGEEDDRIRSPPETNRLKPRERERDELRSKSREEGFYLRFVGRRYLEIPELGHSWSNISEKFNIRE